MSEYHGNFLPIDTPLSFRRHLFVIYLSKSDARYGRHVVAWRYVSGRSDATHERVWHVAGPAIVGGLSLIAAVYLSSPTLAAIALVVCAMSTYAVLPTFWTLPTAFLTGSAAAGGIALINSIGNLGGFVGPYAIGWIKDATGATTLGLVALAACYMMAGVVTLLLGHDSQIEMAASRVLAEVKPVMAG
jgi:nitrate/nitrite transporter NarK